MGQLPPAVAQLLPAPGAFSCSTPRRWPPRPRADGTPTFSSPKKLFNVRDFGAVGNGVANDTAAVQVRHHPQLKGDTRSPRA